METTESCTCCEKIVMTLESTTPFKALVELPNTLDPSTKRFAWKHHTMMTYAMIPRSIDTTTGVVDLYVCLDEDELDDMDLRALAEEFLNRALRPQYRNIRRILLAAPVLTAPKEIGCWKMHHRPLEETA
jgi:hypothetical protein